MSKRWEEKQRREDLRIGTLLAGLYNLAKAHGQGKFLSKHGREDFTPGDFFANLKEPEPTEQEMQNNFLRMFGYEGKDGN